MKSKSRITLSAGLIVLAALTAVGCGANPVANQIQSQSEFSSADLMFAQMMIPHHQQAITMADLAPERTDNPAMLEIAAAIKAAQAPEISVMKSWLTLNSAYESEMGSVDPHAGHDMGDDMSGMDTMMGMLTDAQLDQLRAASGAEFEELFLSGMIEHHEGAIEMANQVSESRNSAVSALAKKVISAQKLEIDKMRAIQQ